MKTEKQKALETLEKVKEIYDADGGDLLCSGFWTEFMHLCDEQIKEIKAM